MKALDRDYLRAFEKSTYRGKFRRALHTWTSPGFQAVAVYRLTCWLMQKRIPVIGAVLQRLTEVWTGISIPPEAKIGPGLLILHFGGIIINSAVVIGQDCTLHHGVTIGNKNPGGASPEIGDRVMIGAGAHVLGGIRIGHDVEIGAGSVVVKPLDDGAVAAGNPARVIRVKPSGRAGAGGPQ